MANRTGTYIGFDGLGKANPTESDFRYYSTMQAWSAGKNIDFRFVNSHDKTAAVRDSSLRSTLESRIRERLSASKNCIVILSGDTRKSGSMLSYEIEKAVDLYKIPLICVYVGYETINQPKELSNRWPNALTTRINNGTAKAIHVPFKKEILLTAINQFSVNNSIPSGALVTYTKEAQERMNSK
ncbi:TIR domain-containing protein [Vibrio hangzhouensis]|uniref:TIR domain-containing protein n=1 Tax=Vibrio hangzhouensis TaxID=462991 RepID=UPI001C962030|nr:TIR domain-containing protein [Vibrio hangzhouensis]MBY6199128.1 TIR domain-containing protein [Vibrio hangzhouensis]